MPCPPRKCTYSLTLLFIQNPQIWIHFIQSVPVNFRSESKCLSLISKTIVIIQLPSLSYITINIVSTLFQVQYIHHQVYTVFPLALAGGNTTKWSCILQHFNTYSDATLVDQARSHCNSITPMHWLFTGAVSRDKDLWHFDRVSAIFQMHPKTPLCIRYHQYLFE